MNKIKGRSARKFRCDEAQERSGRRAERSPKQQLAVLDDRLGKGQGASKERKRLERMIAAPAKTPKKENKDRGRKGNPPPRKS